MVFEGVPAASAAGQAGGVDHAVVGQGGGREAVFRGGGEEGGHDCGDGDGSERGAGEQVAGVVIEEVQDLGVGPVGQGPVGEVRLPGFVGLVGFEAVQGGLGALLRFGDDEPGGVEDPADRGGRGRAQSFAFEVPGDRDGPGVQSGSDQFTAQVQDPVRGRLRWCGADCSTGV